MFLLISQNFWRIPSQYWRVDDIDDVDDVDDVDVVDNVDDVD